MRECDMIWDRIDGKDVTDTFGPDYRAVAVDDGTSVHIRGDYHGYDFMIRFESEDVDGVESEDVDGVVSRFFERLRTRLPIPEQIGGVTEIRLVVVNVAEGIVARYVTERAAPYTVDASEIYNVRVETIRTLKMGELKTDDTQMEQTFVTKQLFEALYSC